MCMEKVVLKNQNRTINIIYSELISIIAFKAINYLDISVVECAHLSKYLFYCL